MCYTSDDRKIELISFVISINNPSANMSIWEKYVPTRSVSKYKIRNSRMKDNINRWTSAIFDFTWRRTAPYTETQIWLISFMTIWRASSKIRLNTYSSLGTICFHHPKRRCRRMILSWSLTNNDKCKDNIFLSHNTKSHISDSI